jgi:hypothetical protein
VNVNVGVEDIVAAAIVGVIVGETVGAALGESVAAWLALIQMNVTDEVPTEWSVPPNADK